ncbi:hypothetical protein GF362_05555 [Candidatus Dojkabacteria bacterium]|nr:hypothetical protein [Candidatus Dojkabacteria bacterium]
MKIIGLDKLQNKDLKNAITKTLKQNIANNLYQTSEFAIVQNPSGVYPKFEIYPLAQAKIPLKKICAILTDMDGTTTTTETLCLYSLAEMIRLITNHNIEKLDQKKDYPNIIGNSTTKHVEYLINKYQEDIDTKEFIKKYIEAVLWTVKNSADQKRKNEVIANSKNTGTYQILENIIGQDISKFKNPKSIIIKCLKNMGKINLNRFEYKVKAAIDIYYANYHQILKQISNGKSQELSTKLTAGKALIKPMNYISTFLPLIKGVLGEEAEYFGKNSEEKSVLKRLGKYFQDNPVKIGLVTSSIFYEADIVLTEIFRKINSDIKHWNVSSKVKQKALKIFSSYNSFYDVVVTADDSHEIRLKPHRDLYSIALYKLGIPQKEFKYVIGFEDSESGTIAIRAAGVGLSIGLPFDDTKGHNLAAAKHIMKNGLYEFVHKHRFLLESLLG